MTPKEDFEKVMREIFARTTPGPAMHALALMIYFEGAAQAMTMDRAVLEREILDYRRALEATLRAAEAGQRETVH